MEATSTDWYTCTAKCDSSMHTHTHQLEIEDFVPTLLYFGYTLVMVFGFWLLTGSIGFYATYIFICRIYGAVKQD